MPNTTLNEQPVSKRQAAQDEAEIRALIESVNRAHYTKDGASLAAPYTADAAIFSLAPPLAHRGMDLREQQAWLLVDNSPRAILSLQAHRGTHPTSVPFYMHGNPRPAFHLEPQL